MKKLAIFKYRTALLFVSCMFWFATTKAQSPDQVVQQAGDAEKSGNYSQAASLYAKAANMYQNAGQNRQAIEAFEKALPMQQKMGNTNGMYMLYNYLGMLYCDENDKTKSLSYFKQSLDIAQKSGRKRDEASILNNMASCCVQNNDYKQGETYYQQALSAALSVSDTNIITSCYSSLASVYANLGNTAKQQEYYNLYQTFYKLSQDKLLADIKNSSDSKVASAMADKQFTEQQLENTSDSLQQAKDTISQKNAAIELLTVQQQLQKARIKEKDDKLKFERTVKYFLIGILVLVSVFSIWLLMLYQDKKRTNKLLKKQKADIERQAFLLDVQNQKINDSIAYAQRIQQTILPIHSEIKAFADFFVLFRPRDVVSGDFYWIHHIPATPYKGEQLLVAAIDCTGHGVPGAFMSLITNRIITEIVNFKREYNPAKILDTLNETIVNELKQEKLEANDGLDACICLFEKQEDKTIVSFAGAKRPLFIYRAHDKTVETINGDRQSVGGVRIKRKNVKKHPFLLHKINLDDNDILYLTSDGYIDQNDANRGRFGLLRFVEMIKQNGHLPMDEQQKYFEQALDQHIHNTDQRDDIIVLAMGANVRLSPKTKNNTLHWENATVLIAEDSDMDFLFLQNILKPTQINIVRVKNGKEAVEYVDAGNPINFVMMDLNMPVMNGFEATEIIKRMNSKIPIIVQTAAGYSEKTNAMEAGCDDYIEKPITKPELLTVLNKYM